MQIYKHMPRNKITESASCKCQKWEVQKSTLILMLNHMQDLNKSVQ